VIIHQVISTEKVPFSYRVAGIGARSLAWLIDLAFLILLFLMGVLCATVLNAMGRPGMATALLMFWRFSLFWAYFLLFEWLWLGQTPGKRLLGLRVIRWQGTGIGFAQAAVRNLLRIVDFLPVGYAVGFTAAACNRESRRLGDLAADTLVVYVDARGPPIRTLQDAPSAGTGGDRVRTGLPRQRLALLGRDQKQTLLDLSLRREQLRVQERARLFRTASQYLQKRLEIGPEEFESDEKFVLRLTALLV
jgi:uncharacterized RDD family membrane protein YckC